MRRYEDSLFTEPRMPDVPNPRKQYMPRSLVETAQALRLSWYSDYALLWVDAPVGAEPTNVDQAGSMFLERARNLPGAMRVVVNYDDAAGEPSFVVHVRKGDINAEYSVYDLIGEIYNRFPNTHLDVLVLDDQD